MTSDSGAARIRGVLRKTRRGPLSVEQIAAELGSDPDPDSLQAVLREMEAAGEVYRVKGGRYALPEKLNLRVGRLSLVRSLDGFVEPRGGGPDVFVPLSLLGSATDGDLVVVRIESRRKGRKPEGRVIKVLERAHPTVVGTFRPGPRMGIVSPLDDRIHRDITIPSGEEGEARKGDIVVARVLSWGDRRLSPVGVVERVLGPIDEPGVDVLAILFGFGLDLEFPPEVEEEAQAVATRKEPLASRGRSDRTDLHVFTIDPEDARDHDDALSITELGSGLFEVGVHIADVSYYIERSSALDAEAWKRGTSVYLVDRVVPMIPHLFSSDLCSLRPEVPRPAVSLFLRMDSEGQVRGHRIERTVVQSRHRLNYSQVQSVLEGQGTVDRLTDGHLMQLADLARALRRRRLARGSLDFDLPEAHVLLDADGAPIDVQRVIQLESHRLIEDFMLLANETIAAQCEARGLPIPYRVHEPPPLDRLEELRRFLATLGYTLPARSVRGKDLQRVLDASEGKPEAALVSTLILRSMARARYQPENVGHFGLAASTYTHFTSPIRRYPDLMTHRVVVQALIEGRSVPASWGGKALEEACLQATEREELAAEAERESVALKKAEFMERHLGEEFQGTVSGVTSFGLFVLLDEYFVEGLVHVSSIADDFYLLQEDEYALIGERTGRRFRLGDPLRVQVARVNRLERKIDFVLVDENGRKRV